MIKKNSSKKGQKNTDSFSSSGGALDLFYRFGFYSLSIRVVPREDPGTWLVREPTARVFEDNSVEQIERKGLDSFDKQPFQVYSIRQLLDKIVFSKKNFHNFFYRSTFVKI